MPQALISGHELLFLGVKHILQFEHRTTIHVENNIIYFPRALGFRSRKELETWYRQQALGYITKRVEHFAKRMNVTYVSVSIADTKSRWGACTVDNRLQFNWRLIMTPHAVLDSVIVHELAHVKEKNHSQQFWISVRKVFPGYHAHRQWLNHHQEELSF